YRNSMPANAVGCGVYPEIRRDRATGISATWAMSSRATFSGSSLSARPPGVNTRSTPEGQGASHGPYWHRRGQEGKPALHTTVETRDLLGREHRCVPRDEATHRSRGCLLQRLHPTGPGPVTVMGVIEPVWARL